MPGKEIKGRSKIANYRYGGRTGKQTGGRTNLLEELGRVEAEPSNRNRRAEISRVHGELNRGYKHGKRVKKNGPVRPIDIPWPTSENPVPSKRVSKKFSEKWTKKNKKRRIGKRRAT